MIDSGGPSDLPGGYVEAGVESGFFDRTGSLSEVTGTGLGRVIAKNAGPAAGDNA
jgi:hypothetical protein